MSEIARLTGVARRVGAHVTEAARRASRVPYVHRVLRAYRRYSDSYGTRLAGAITYFGFLSLFPLIALAAAIVAGTLGPGQIDRIQREVNEALPGLTDKVSLDPVLANATTVGVVGALVLLWSGLGWVDATREAVRTVFGLDPQPRNLVQTKALDIAALIGLGLTLLVSVGASTVGTTLTEWVARQLGLADTLAGDLGLRLLGVGLSLLTGFVLFLYVLVGLPRVGKPDRSAIEAAVIGAVGFEVLKWVVSSYISGVAGRNIYGAFGVPVALLLWMNFVSRLLLICAAWGATGKPERRERERS